MRTLSLHIEFTAQEEHLKDIVSLQSKKYEYTMKLRKDFFLDVNTF